MKITCGRLSNSLRVFNTDGKDITESLDIIELTIKMRPNEPTTAEMLIAVTDLAIDIDDDQCSTR